MAERPELAPGLYARLVDEELRKSLIDMGDSSRGRVRVYPERGQVADLSRALASHLSERLVARLESLGSHEERLELCNLLMGVLGEGGELEGPPAVMLEAVERGGVAQPEPAVPLNANTLLTNTSGTLGLVKVVRSELPTAERVDLICAFVKWSGLRLVRPQLEAHTQRGRPLRVLTTTYMGASDTKAVAALVELGADVRVCYEHHATRLHAKAWLFERPRQATTALVGSSNMSESAFTDGMEWNVRLTQRLAPDVIARFQEVFDLYWDDPIFEPFDADRFARAIASQRVANPVTWAAPSTAPPLVAPANDDAAAPLRATDLAPYPYQETILERLTVDRTRHARHRNLVVAATGVGKTMIAAFDFARLRARHPEWTLLFVAHRRDILEQSLRTFRSVLGEEGFGELYVGGSTPTEWANVFASVQSLNAGEGVSELDPAAFDVVILDECHHAAAASYVALLDHLTPRELLGLTATPERADGASILEWFGGRVSAEMRLWDALGQGLLAPFHYFAFDDGTDLRGLSCARGRYTINDLEGVYTADDARARLILSQVERTVTDPKSMRAIGFCVSIAHAEFMAEAFSEAGYAALALTSRGSTRDERAEAPGRLGRGELQVVFTVDLYNEGVDIPSVDTLLMLRPTESATVFLQQLGRGLRRAPGKSCVTVLDFVGHTHDTFDLAGRYTLLTGRTRAQLRRDLEADDALYLPSGCAIDLDRVTSERVLTHIKASLKTSLAKVTSELEAAGDVSMSAFLDLTGMDVAELYRGGSWWWTKLRARAGLTRDESQHARALSSALGARLHRLVHIDDSERLALYRDVLSGTTPPALPDDGYRRNMLLMLVNQLWGKRASGPADLDEAVSELWAQEDRRGELLELLGVLEERADVVTRPLVEVRDTWPEDVPLSLHGTYTREEVLTAFGKVGLGETSGSREGVWRDRARKIEVLFVTLDKDPDVFSASVRYRDHPIGTSSFHWESQNATAPETPTGRRYIEHVEQGWTMVLFVRRSGKDERGLKGAPFRCLGPVTYTRHTGSKPMAIVWELDHDMPRGMFDEARQVS